MNNIILCITNFGIASSIYYLSMVFLRIKSPKLSLLETHNTKNGPIDIYESKIPDDCYYSKPNNIIVMNKKLYENNFVLNHELQHFYDRKLSMLNNIVHTTLWLVCRNSIKFLPLILLSHHQSRNLFEKRADKHACEVSSPEDLIDGFTLMKNFETEYFSTYNGKFLLKTMSIIDVHPSYEWRLKLISDTYKYKTGMDLPNDKF